MEWWMGRGGVWQIRLALLLYTVAAAVAAAAAGGNGDVRGIAGLWSVGGWEVIWWESGRVWR